MERMELKNLPCLAGELFVNTKRLVSRLLSGKDELSVLEKDEILANVLAEVAPAKKSFWRRPGLLLPLVGVAVALVLIPVVMRADGASSTVDFFAARGHESRAAAVTLVCPTPEGGIGKGACQADDKLIFDLSASAGYSFFAAFARGEQGTVIWYFPEAEGGHSLNLEKSLDEGVLDRGVTLGADHPRGRYELYGIFSDEPLTRDLIKDRFSEDSTEIGLGTAVTRGEFTVQ